MKSSSANTFKQATEKAFSDPSIQINQDTTRDALNLMSSFNEEKDSEKTKGGKVSQSHSKAQKNIKAMSDIIKKIDDESLRREAASWMVKDFKKQFRDFDSENFLKMCDVNSEKSETKEDTEKVSSKQQFAKDLQSDPDFQEFKKNAKYKKGGAEFTFGVPNVSNEDPYIKKQTKYGRPGRGKEETKEATGSGSSGAFVAPMAFSKDFMKRSNAENPKPIKEEVGEGETTEATGTGSSGAYETPSAWAKSTKAKDWGGKRKTQYPGGSFVSVKKKCTKFPYCNQGDINALKLSKNESVSEAIKNVANKLGLKESYIQAILEFEYEKLNKRTK